MEQAKIRNDNRFGRRRVLKLVSASSLGGLSFTASAAASQYRPKVTRIKGSYNGPIGHNEAREALEDLIAKSPSAHSSSLERQARSEFQDGFEIVEYVARVGPNGRVSQYYGASLETTEATAHAKGSNKLNTFKASVGTTSTPPPVESGPDWFFVNDWQADESGHWGELNHNLEWYHVNEDSEDRNAFRSLIASSDDTIVPYSRWISTEHDWGESELGGESIHNAGPSQTDNDGYTVSIGYPLGGSLSWNGGGSGKVRHNVDNDAPSADWTIGIPKNGTSWFYPGSHVVADEAEPGDKVMTDRAEVFWGAAYRLWHNWHMVY